MIKSISGVVLCAALVSGGIYADDLIDVYNLALKNDPTFQGAQAQWMADQQNLPMAKAGYRPIIDLSGTASASFYNQGNYPGKNHVSTSYPRSYTLAISQPLIDFSAWDTIDVADYGVKAATATYAASGQDLMMRVANAYFTVLAAYDTVDYDAQYLAELQETLNTSRQQYKVGLIAITPVMQAQSQFDQQTAQVIADKNSLSDALEALNAITKKQYTSLSGIASKVPLVTPQPNDIDQWVQGAESQNNSLQAANYTTLAAKKQIKADAAGRYPTLSIGAGVDAGEASTTDGDGNYDRTAAASVSAVSLSLDFPMYQGGLVSATTKQDRYLYLQAAASLDATHRQVVQNTRTGFLGVMADISKIKADYKTVDSAEQSLKSTKASYTVGNSTMDDVLTQASILAQAQQQLSADQYAYLIGTLTLKEEAGTLSVADLEVINGWLKQKVTFANSQAQSSKENSVKGAPMKTLTKPAATSATASPALSSGRYTIQLFASKTNADAKAFVQSLPSSPMISVAQAGGWYKVVYGDYGTYGQAHAALSQLPAAMQAHKPWVYHYSDKSTQVSHAAPVKKQVVASSNNAAVTPSSVANVNEAAFSGQQTTLAQHVAQPVAAQAQGQLPQPR